LKSAIDTNIISSLFGAEPSGRLLARSTSADLREEGALVICGVVYAELLAHPRVPPKELSEFLRDTDIEADFATDRELWVEIGIRYSRCATRRRRAKGGSQRRLLADFVIGAHALLRADRLVTFNGADFRSDFPELKIFPARRTQ
jgi:hypothetical protein